MRGMRLLIFFALTCSLGAPLDAGEVPRVSPPPPSAPASSAALVASPKLVFAHMMLCFAAFGPLGNSSEAIAGYVEEISVAAEAGLDGLAIEWLGHDAYYAPAASGMFAACEAYNAARAPGSPPFKLFIIINFCCGLQVRLPTHPPAGTSLPLSILSFADPTRTRRGNRWALAPL